MTASLPPDLRARLGAVIQEARRVAESGARRALASLAVDCGTPFDSMSPTERALRNALQDRGLQAGDRPGRFKGTQQITRLAHEVAYEHWHRMLFARFLAENELLIAPDYGVAVSLEDCRELARERGRDPWELAGAWAQRMLPGIFTDGDPALELALPPETRQKLEELLESLPTAIFTAQDSLGWTYQYWRSDEKDRVNSSGRKVGADELPAVTQLFTERYMVLFPPAQHDRRVAGGEDAGGRSRAGGIGRGRGRAARADAHSRRRRIRFHLSSFHARRGHG